MLKKIHKIRNFGVFRDIPAGNQPNAMPEFGTINLIYGWNYSGKTTLSRAFACLETDKKHPDYSAAQVSFEGKEGALHGPDTDTSIKVRVYNEDFRKANLRWDGEGGHDEGDIKPIVVFGESNIAAQKNLESERAKLKSINSELGQVKSQKSEIESKIQTAKTTTARSIARALSLTNFTKKHLNSIILKWGAKTIPEPMNEEEVAAARAIATGEVKPVLPHLVFTCAPLDDLWARAASAFATSLVSTATINALVADPITNRWVGEGMALHRERSHCAFCENSLSADRIAALNAHFSRAHEELRIEIGGLIEALKARRLVLDETPYIEAAFYKDFYAERRAIAGKIAAMRTTFNTALDAMIGKLEAKRNAPFSALEINVQMPDVPHLMNTIAKFGDLIQRHNDRTNNFEAEKETAKKQLIDHYSAVEMRASNLRSLEFQIGWADGLLKILERKIGQSETDITRLNNELSSARNAADQINRTLKQFFGKDDISINPTDDDRFRLMRGAEPAKNLSEGERTAIAFCYFVASLFNEQSGIAGTIVYIDDPISSLDANHLFHMNAFIKETFYKKIRGKNNVGHECKAQQLFISTHNLEFFHLVHDWAGTGTKASEFRRSYMVERVDTSVHTISRIVECPDTIHKYKSLYLLCYHQLKQFIAVPKDDAMTLFNIGNVARRFLEGYLHVRYLEHHSIEANLPNLIADPVNRERVRKFVHSHSHTLTSGAGMTLPDMSEASNILNIIIDAVKEDDPKHYAALERACPAII